MYRVCPTAVPSIRSQLCPTACLDPVPQWKILCPWQKPSPQDHFIAYPSFSFKSNQACCLSYRYFRLHYVSTSIYHSTSYGAFELWTEHCSQTTDVVEGVWTAQQHQNYCLLMTSSLGHCLFQYNFCVCFHQSVCLSVWVTEVETKTLCKF